MQPFRLRRQHWRGDADVKISKRLGPLAPQA
jgi:hypothetical protein